MAELNISLENVTICHARLLNYSLDGPACGDNGLICSFPEVCSRSSRARMQQHEEINVRNAEEQQEPSCRTLG